MTSEIEALKTNEFLRRRKLRLQQVREQSKDIAKKLRVRADVVRLRHIVELDSRSERKYLRNQERQVQELEKLYAAGKQHFGAGHNKASAVTLLGDEPEKVDLSKSRGKEAAAKLRQKRQQKLDEQKKLLERKLKAREAANVISREKSKTDFNQQLKPAGPCTDNVKETEVNNNKPTTTTGEIPETLVKNDMATQWDFDAIPNEWEPHIPQLTLPAEEDNDKETATNIQEKPEKAKRLDLFAVSDEMPSSLRTRSEYVVDDPGPLKPSLTLVSEFLQNRSLRLREPETAAASKGSNDLQSIKQTILRTRESKLEAKQNAADKAIKTKIPETLANRKTTAIDQRTLFSAKPPTDRTIKTNLSEAPKKNPVTVYNHCTKDSRHVPSSDDVVVSRDRGAAEDAYLQAMRVSSEVTHASASGDGELDRNITEVRNKVAMTKQSVEKEYRDTVAFLNTLSRNKSTRPNKTAFMDGDKQQRMKDIRQKKMQEEFQKIEREGRKQVISSMRSRQSSKSPINIDIEDETEPRDFQYSWMPVPESDASLAVHTIPTTREKSGNSVKFSKVDSYHEYRSRHKHTPPTKESHERIPPVPDNSVTDESSCSSASSGTSVQSERKPRRESDRDLADAERIIIYKIIESRRNKDKGRKSKRVDIAKSLGVVEKARRTKRDEERSNEDVANPVTSVEQLKEGVYKTVSEKGILYNLTTSHTTNMEFSLLEKPWWNNMKSMQLRDPSPSSSRRRSVEEGADGHPGRCRCGGECRDRAGSRGPADVTDTPIIQWKSCDETTNKRDNTPTSSTCRCNEKRKSGERISPKHEQSKLHQHPATTSTEPSSTGTCSSSTTDRTESNKNPEPPGSVMMRAEDLVQETGKFYIGTTGFMKNDDYEVVIQLRKKDVGVSAKMDDKESSKDLREETVKEVVDAVIHEVAREIVENSEEVANTPETVSTQTVKSSEIMPKQRVGTTAREAKVDEHNKSQVSNKVPELIGTEPLASKPSSTACTQTSFSSPSAASRPLLFHMSSSTSTTYMSPPEVIRPRYLSPHQAGYERDEAKPREKQECRCRKCLRRKTEKSKENNMNRDERRHLKAPPNTARQSKDSIGKTSSSNLTQRDTRSVASNTVPSRRCSCRTCMKEFSRKIIQTGYSYHCVPDSPVANTGRKNNAKTTTNKSRPNSKLNPVIKNYVNRLLTLSKESMKAIEVIDQECSSVTTPGSSILNIDTNFDQKKLEIGKKISLEQVKQILAQKILTSHAENNSDCKTKNSKKNRKKSVHKVKSFNISKNLLKTNIKISSTSTKEESDKYSYLAPAKSKSQLPTSPKRDRQTKTRSRPTSTNEVAEKTHHINKHSTGDGSHTKPKCISHHQATSSSLPAYSTTTASMSSNNGVPGGPGPRKGKCSKRKVVPDSINQSTHTIQSLEADINMKLVENKLQNMDKIADLTEKCTQRLSDLAKVLDEVRKSKSMAYSHISTSDASSEGDLKSKKIAVLKSSSENTDNLKTDSDRTISDNSLSSNKVNDESPEYSSMLQGIPKPGTSLFTPPKHIGHHTVNVERTKGKPPPALSRIHLKLDTDDVIVPHELSTVIEVDSPMSVRVRSQSTRSENRSKEKLRSPTDPKEMARSPTDTNEKKLSPSSTKEERVRSLIEDKSKETRDRKSQTNEEQLSNPDLLQSNASQSKPTNKPSQVNKLGTKMEMMDLKKFNDIMLKPFVSIAEYAKQCNAGVIDDVSNFEEHPRDVPMATDDLSSLHSEGSLPDVIGELLKRNIIAEPFRFDTSNMNSATISSESSLSVFTLPKPSMGREKRKTSVALQNKDNIGDTSDTLSVSSNPDLENAFQKLGIGWASSTLKKTKERLALSSSSSNSSITQKHKFKHLEKHEQSIGKGKPQQGQENDMSRNVEQQTSASTSVTVQEFLNNELAKKITFSTQPNRNVSDREFISLYETQMPEEMKNDSNVVREERSMDGNRERARTSTPVQIFKSMTYHSSSSSNNMSNGLFSNVDELSSVKATSSSMQNHSTSDKDDLTIPNYSLRMRRDLSDGS